MNDAATMSREVCKTLNCMDEVSSVLVSFGMSFDANFTPPFNILEETAHTLKCGTCPDWKSGVMIEFGKGLNNEER